REGFAANATFRIFGCHVQDIVDGRAFKQSSRSLIKSTVLQVIRAAYIVQLNNHTAAGKELRRKKKPASVTLDMGVEFDLEDARNKDPHLPQSFTSFNKAELKELHYNLGSSFFPDKKTG